MLSGVEPARASSRPRASAADIERGGALRLLFQLLGGIAAITAGVTAILLVTGGERAAVKSYVTLLRDHKSSEAYAMLASARKAELSPDAFPQKLHTALLASSTDVDITSSSRTAGGKGCVTASLEAPGGKRTVHFYVLEENGTKTIHSVLTSEDFGAGGLASVEPWHCE